MTLSLLLLLLLLLSLTLSLKAIATSREYLYSPVVNSNYILSSQPQEERLTLSLSLVLFMANDAKPIKVTTETDNNY